jgi:hypothetical protein
MCGAMVIVLHASVGDLGFDPVPGKLNYYNPDSCCLQMLFIIKIIITESKWPLYDTCIWSYLIQTLTHVIYIIEMMNPCDATPCQNGGTCTRLSGVSYRCDSATGYSGTNCQGIIWFAHNYIYHIYNLENSKFANNGNTIQSNCPVIKSSYKLNILKGHLY